jgi:hypothetical protein
MATVIISGMTLGTSGNLTGAAVLEMEDSLGASVHFTAATLRTKMFAGGTGYTANDPLTAGAASLQAVTVGGTAWGFDGISAAIGSVSGMRFNNASTTRLLTLFQSAVIGFGDNGASDANGSPGNIIIGNSTAPTGNPTTGGFLFSTSGALKWRGSSGTITTIAPA